MKFMNKYFVRLFVFLLVAAFRVIEVHAKEDEFYWSRSVFDLHGKFVQDLACLCDHARRLL